MASLRGFEIWKYPSCALIRTTILRNSCFSKHANYTRRSVCFKRIFVKSLFSTNVQCRPDLSGCHVTSIQHTVRTDAMHTDLNTTNSLSSSDTSTLSEEELLFRFKRDLRIRLKLSELHILQQYRKEYEILRSDNDVVPKRAPLQMWIDLLDTNNRKERHQVYKHYHRQEQEVKTEEEYDPLETYNTFDRAELKETCREELMEHIRKEHEYSLRTGKFRVPNHLPAEGWEELFQCPSFFRRLEVYTKYLNLEQEKMAREENRKKEEELIEYHQMIREGREDELMESRENVNLCCPQMTEQQMQRFLLSKQFNARLYGPEIIFDIGYGKYERDSIKYELFVEHFWRTNEINLSHKNPFHFVLCNAQKAHSIIRYMNVVNREQYEHQMFSVSSRDVRDIARGRRLVYLVGNAEKTMDYYDHDAVYVIPAIHDQYNVDTDRLIGVETQKLPIHDFVFYHHMLPEEKKTLPLECVVRLLLELKDTGCWDSAFRLADIPNREVSGFTGFANKAQMGKY